MAYYATTIWIVVQNLLVGDNYARTFNASSIFNSFQAPPKAHSTASIRKVTIVELSIINKEPKLVIAFRTP